jgi:hypothetical protein
MRWVGLEDALEAVEHQEVRFVVQLFQQALLAVGPG